MGLPFPPCCYRGSCLQFSMTLVDSACTFWEVLVLPRVSTRRPAAACVGLDIDRLDLLPILTRFRCIDCTMCYDWTWCWYWTQLSLRVALGKSRIGNGVGDFVAVHAPSWSARRPVRSLRRTSLRRTKCLNDE